MSAGSSNERGAGDDLFSQRAFRALAALVFPGVARDRLPLGRPQSDYAGMAPGPSQNRPGRELLRGALPTCREMYFFCSAWTVSRDKASGALSFDPLSAWFWCAPLEKPVAHEPSPVL